MLSLLFADNTTLLLNHDNLKILTVTVNEELQKVCEYFRINKMVLHPEKTKLMLFSRGAGGEDPALYCNNNNTDQNLPYLISVLGRVTSTDATPAIKFLGVFFDPALNFKHHISTLKINSLVLFMHSALSKKH